MHLSCHKKNNNVRVVLLVGVVVWFPARLLYVRPGSKLTRYTYYTSCCAAAVVVHVGPAGGMYVYLYNSRYTTPKVPLIDTHTRYACMYECTHDVVMLCE